MKTFVAALVAAGAAVAAGSATAQSSYPSSYTPYRYSGQAPAYHAHDANCADGSCATGGLVPNYGDDACADGSCGCRPGECPDGLCAADCEHAVCGPECDPAVPHRHVAGIAHGHAAGCADGRCGHTARRTQDGHVCSDDGCDHTSLGGTTALDRRPAYRIGNGDPRQRPASASSLRPVMTRPATRFSSGQSFPGGSYRPTTNDGFENEQPFSVRPRANYPARPARGMQTQRSTSPGGGPFGEGFSGDSRPW